ncbi:hypothetical protein N7474_011260 [Penicillium riverlandense]|uniref:uncharacterized protein n=1 Tax=Penicillium riverlandense TaxID=1903569 RepID=UPI0025472715|nr:uncharacterized protein N7474_011260 [Penicillium riverlandense]KAJ5805373.1 hypothetical protein N7474_011260 [Penicillium riverlandense]
MLPHSWIFGHLHHVGKTMANYPSDVHGQYMPLLLAKDHPELEVPGLMYIDIWPIAPPMLAVFHPEMMAQFTQTTSLPKHPSLAGEFRPFTQLNDLLNMSGETWKAWRGIFNPAFSVKNILSLIPAFLEEIDVFVDQLNGAAECGEIFRLEDKAINCTIDIIGRAVLDIRLHCQTSKNELHETLKRQIALLWASNAPDQLAMALNPLRPFRMWNNNRIIKNYLRPHIERGIHDHMNGKATRHKTINSLATKTYFSEPDSSSETNAADAHEHFMDILIAQIKIFLFAGHDTTATALSYCYYFLNKSPSALATLRAEHDAVLGPDTSRARVQIAANPALLNQLPYTSGVIKETLRLFPPVGTIRKGLPDFYLTHPETGKQYPTKGFMLFGLSFGVQRAEEFWPRATEFLPERWLAKEGEPLHVRKNAWRPFEQGLRNCIGQELAQIELRAILALTVREMEIEPVFPDDSPVVFGEKAYQVMETTRRDASGLRERRSLYVYERELVVGRYRAAS